MKILAWLCFLFEDRAGAVQQHVQAWRSIVFACTWPMGESRGSAGQTWGKGASKSGGTSRCKKGSGSWHDTLDCALSPFSPSSSLRDALLHVLDVIVGTWSSRERQQQSQWAEDSARRL